MADLSKLYIDKVVKKAKVAQETNDIPTTYAFSYNEKDFLMMLPRSVMAQKKMVFVRNEYLSTNSFEKEEELLGMILENTTVGGHSLSINDLDFGEIEVVKTAYLDELILPLSLGGDKAITEYMQKVVNNK